MKFGHTLPWLYNVYNYRGWLWVIHLLLMLPYWFYNYTSQVLAAIKQQFTSTTCYILTLTKMKTILTTDSLVGNFSFSLMHILLHLYLIAHFADFYKATVCCTSKYLPRVILHSFQNKGWDVVLQCGCKVGTAGFSGCYQFRMVTHLLQLHQHLEYAHKVTCLQCLLGSIEEQSPKKKILEWKTTKVYCNKYSSDWQAR